MRISYWPSSVALNGKQPYDAMLHSLRHCGHQLEKENFESDAAVIWSVLWHGRMLSNQQVWTHYRQQNKPVIVVEVGGIKRGTTWKVGLNGINRDAVFLSCNNNHDRANNIGLELKPWQTNGEFILVCGQHDRSLQWQGMISMSHWFMKIIDQIQTISSRPIIIRPHPRCRVDSIESQYRNVYRQEPNLISGTYDDFDLNFYNIWATVSYNSNPGPQSVIAGIPAFVGTNSLAADVGNSIDFLNNIETPSMPCREQWRNDYAWTEFTVDEIADGLALKGLGQALNANIINAMI